MRSRVESFLSPQNLYLFEPKFKDRNKIVPELVPREADVVPLNLHHPDLRDYDSF